MAEDLKKKSLNTRLKTHENMRLEIEILKKFHVDYVEEKINRIEIKRR